MHVPMPPPAAGPTAEFAIRRASAANAAALAFIYNPYVTETAITFEESPLGPPDMAVRVAEADASGLPFLVAEAPGALLGFAFASRWKGRCAYRYTAETSAYVGRDHWRLGVGSALYGQLILQLQRVGYHAAIGGIALPNEPSIALHERLGFARVATFRQVGFKFRRWIDVGYWQRLFD